MAALEVDDDFYFPDSPRQLHTTPPTSPSKRVKLVEAADFQDVVNRDKDVAGEAAEIALALHASVDEEENFEFEPFRSERIDQIPSQADYLRAKAHKPFTASSIEGQQSEDQEDHHDAAEERAAKRPRLSDPVRASDRDASELELDEGFGPFDVGDTRTTKPTNSPATLHQAPCALPTTVVSSHLQATQDANISPDQSQSLPHLSQIFPVPRARPVAASTRSEWASLPPIQARDFSGRLIYLQRRTRSSHHQHTGEHGDPYLPTSASNLLEEPIHRLIERVTRQINTPPQANGIQQNLRQKPVDCTLWTDRYKPTKFVDLLGDERVFRNAMSWLKEWDACVFTGTASAASRRKELKKRLKEQAATNDPFEYSDPLGRPAEKVLMLCGPPGLGKTTMAHVLASQAGYNVVEINASDDRSANVVTNHIKALLETRTLDRKGKGGGLQLRGNRPTCVVIDEVDGAGGNQESGFVRALVKLVTDGSFVSRSKRQIKKGDRDRPLVRPIICICNDVYAPALRPLRPISKIIRCAAPTANVLSTRLRSICGLENLRGDSKDLSFLVEKTGGDIRSCLNSLQFIKSLGNVVDEASVTSAALGQKDMGTSAQTALSSLFRVPHKKSTNHDPNSHDRGFLYRVVKDVSACGEYDRIAKGCFEYYPSAKQPADVWSAYTQAHDWLNFYNRLDKKISRDQAYELLPYVPYSLVPWHPLLASLSNKTPDYPRLDYEMYMRMSAHQEIADAFRSGLLPSVRNNFSAENIVKELMPMMMRIISPDLRAVHGKLVKKDDQATLSRMVNIMLDLNLSFVQSRTDEGQLTFKIEPPIDVFIMYDGKRSSDVAQSKFSTRQMMESERVRRLLPVDEASGATRAAAIIDAYKKILPTKAPAAIIASDFFGRPIEVKENTLSTVNIPTKVTVSFRYHEGFSNAVKKPLKVRELLQQ